jgi:hypothetical protein
MPDKFFLDTSPASSDMPFFIAAFGFSASSKTYNHMTVVASREAKATAKTDLISYAAQLNIVQS